MIRATAIVQIVGKPKEHVEKVVKDVSSKVDESGYTTERIDVMPVEPLEEEETMFSGLFEVDLALKNHEQVFGFIQDFNPLSIEVSEPDEFEMRLSDYNGLVSTVAATVQQYDQLLKEKIGENITLQRRADQLIRNLILLSVAIKPKNKASIKTETGISDQVLGPYLERLVTEGQLVLDGSTYSLAKNKSASSADTA